jgi:hypothetical protein
MASVYMVIVHVCTLCRFGAYPAYLEEFWTRLKASPMGGEMIAMHPYLRDVTDFRHIIPISLHFDAGPFTKNRSVMVVSWGGATRYSTGNEAFCRFLVGTWIKESGQSPNENKLWRELRHSFAQLGTGRFTGTYSNGKRAKRGDGDTNSGPPLIDLASVNLAMAHIMKSVSNNCCVPTLGHNLSIMCRAQVPQHRK